MSTVRAASRELRLVRALDVRATLGPMRLGKGDPSCLLRHDAFLRASRTPDGPATLRAVVRGDRVLAEAWGPGADWSLDHLPVLLGEADDTSDFRPAHALVAELVVRLEGMRIGATHRVLEALVPALCGEGLSGFEGRRAHRLLLERYGTPAPGPLDRPLIVPPDPAILAGAEFHALLGLGLEQQRADAVRRAAAGAGALESIVDLGGTQTDQRLRSVPGVGVWSAAIVRQVALGDPDAVPVGDPAAKHLVAWVFLGERRGTDSAMLELLEPFRGNRGRVLRLLKAARLGPPSHG